jgi:3-phosphoglycerate kinase
MPHVPLPSAVTFLNSKELQQLTGILLPQEIDILEAALQGQPSPFIVISVTQAGG